MPLHALPPGFGGGESCDYDADDDDCSDNKLKDIMSSNSESKLQTMNEL